MIKIPLQQTDSVLSVISKIKETSDLNIELEIPEESVLFENILNLRLIQQQADKIEKSTSFTTQDEYGNVLIDILSGKDIELIPEEFADSGEYFDKKSFSLPKIKNPFENFRVPGVGRIKKGIILIPLIIASLIGAFIYYGNTAPKAKVVITVGAQPYTRSITIKVKSEDETSTENMILKGSVLTASVQETAEAETTGTKIVGEKAEGEITLYNKTSSKIELEKGDTVKYTGKSEDLSYTLKGDVEIPASTPQDPLDPASPLNPGEAKVKIVAKDIGDDYNLDDGKSFEIEDYEESELEGKNKDKVSGGSSKEVKIVTQEDMDNLSNQLRGVSAQKAEESIKEKLGISQKLIAGSTKTSINSENFSAEIDDETDKISLTQGTTGEALIYNEKDLNKFIEDYFKSVIPEGHYMPEKDKKVTVNILGQSASSVLKSNEADIQVTLSSIIIPDIKEEDVKENLKGRTNEEAKQYIDSLKNVESYEFNISPVVPFFSKVPKDTQRIEVTLNKMYKGEAL